MGCPESVTCLTTIKLLGSGSSQGIPVIGCNCPCCQSTDPQDQHTRMSVFLRFASGKNPFIDCSPDLRSNALRANSAQIHCFLITHTGPDHIFDLDDTKVFSFKKVLPVYASPAHAADLRARFPPAFDDVVLTQGGNIQVPPH
jgi:phosphoribosyl 1,2-cyclic phosphate phosphodiesterase